MEVIEDGENYFMTSHDGLSGSNVYVEVIHRLTPDI